MFIYEKRWTEEQQEEGQEPVEIERVGIFYAEGSSPSDDDVEVLFGGPDSAEGDRKTFDELKEEGIKFAYNRDKLMWVGISDRQLPDEEEDTQLIGFAGDKAVIGAPKVEEEEEGDNEEAPVDPEPAPVDPEPTDEP